MPQPGDRIGNFEIVAELGGGGMATVYTARHVFLDSVVAIKVLSPELVAHAGIRARFLDEGRIQANLRHPNVVAVHDVVAMPGIAALVMELVDGPSLAAVLAAPQDHADSLPNPADAASLLYVARPILSALGHAHAAGVVHRDVKPANILLARTPKGVVPKLMDFGVAHVEAGSAGHAPTRAGQVIGTPAYMAPEQVLGQDVDARTDLYALAVTLYEMATGREPFGGATELELMNEVVAGDCPSLDVLRPDLPAPLRRTIAGAMSPDPADRFADAQAMSDSLDGLGDRGGLDGLGDRGGLDGAPSPAQAAPAPLAVERAPLRIELAFDPRVNFALQQNAVPVVQELVLAHTGEPVDEPIRGATLRLRLEPDLAEPWSVGLADLAPGDSITLSTPNLRLRPEPLVNLLERARGHLVAEVTLPADPEPAVLLRHVEDIELLAYNEWTGLRAVPELLAAFVLPNHPAIAPLLKAAAGHLADWTADPALDGYQSGDRDRVRQVAAAVYTAIQDAKITYVEAPSSFEERGQKIRTPDQVTNEQLANCLDISCLAAACLEQAGLHPLLVIIDGHALPAVWLGEEQFPDAAVDVLRVRKRAELFEIAIFDSSTATARPRRSFEDAEQAARVLLADPARHLVAIDVVEARARGFLPLPGRVVGPEGWRVVLPITETGRGAAPPEPLALSESMRGRSPRGPREPPPVRIARWKRRLLDLTLRNRLLAWRETSRSLPLLLPDVGVLEDLLVRGETLAVWGRPDLLEGRDPRDPALRQEMTGQDVLSTYLSDHLVRGSVVHSVATEAMARRRLIELYRAARSALLEGGANILYLALGLLRWFETDKSTEPRLAPLLLVPVELVRRNARETPRLRIRDDETRLNITLLRKLQQDFGIEVEGVAELPEDEDGVDVRGVFDAFRTAIVDVPRWTVVEDAVLGLFSFQKFLMWRDLDARTDSLLSNPVVAHLVHQPDAPYPAEAEYPDPATLDANRPVLDALCPLDADSSQLAAVFAASDGLSFVLEGPPGTGKSQTITNLIAHNLAHGRTVLFVSEKMAALEVVHGRLQRVGLAPFLLELHSNKASKKDVIEQLRTAVQLDQRSPPGGWEEHARQLQDLRGQLNAYSEAIHRPRGPGLSVFEATDVLVGLAALPDLRLDLGPVDGIGPIRWAELFAIADQLVTAASAVQPIAEHPYRAAGIEEWQRSAVPDLEIDLARLRDAAQSLAVIAAEAAEQLGLDRTIADSAEGLMQLRDLIDLLRSSPAPTRALVAETGWSNLQQEVAVWDGHGRRFNALWADLGARWERGLLELDELPDLRARFTKWAGGFFLIGWLFLIGGRRILARVAEQGRLGANRMISADLDVAMQARAEQHELASSDGRADHLLGRLWRGADTDWDAVGRLVGWADRFRRALRARAVAASGAKQRLVDLAIEGPAPLAAEEPLGRTVRALQDALDRFADARDTVVATLVVDVEAAWGDPSAAGHLRIVAERATDWLRSIRQLRDWSHYVRVRRAAREQGLGPAVASWEGGELPLHRLKQAFSRGLHEWLVEAATAEDPALRSFHGMEHSRKVARFRELDEDSIRLAREVVEATLAARMPRAGVATAGEMGFLLRQLKRKRHIPTRELLAQIPNLLPRIKPCVLMSPLSVAQYLDADFPPFDLVVFDEASQIPVWDAVGAMARGRQVIVVGDSMQLPPTSFFMKATEEHPEDEGDYEEMESILDECIAAGLPRRALGWHYRSRHEQLIAFSNAHYYDSGLLTFPAADAEVAHLGISLVLVAGVYERGGKHTNQLEAETVVAEVVRRLRDPVERQRSIGVVTFSLSQQTLIEDLLDRARDETPSIEPYFSDAVAEPLFIKNLENVQGDERDVILFSVCYGPDATGRVYMNFGPLNNAGGERRLNVAVTRARQQLVVFSSLQASQIDLARTAATGVHHLKTFLRYAEHGAIALPRGPGRLESREATAMERTIAAALEARGHVVDLVVGTSDYRVDLAVRDPEEPDRYLLGIETDGASYRTARTARDRDRLRPGVMQGLGWRLVRCWSSDFQLDPDKELAALLVVLDEALADRGERPLDGSNAPVEVRADDGRADEREPIAEQEPEVEVELELEVLTGVELPEPPPIEGPEEFFSGAIADVWLRTALAVIIREEAPVERRSVLRRLLEPFGRRRVTSRNLRRLVELEALLPRDAAARIVTEPDGTEIYWRPDQEPEEWTGFRLWEEPRALDVVPQEEIAAAAEQVLRDSIALSRRDLHRATAGALGIQRTGRRVNARIDLGIALLEARGRCAIDGDEIRLPR